MPNRYQAIILTNWRWFISTKNIYVNRPRWDTGRTLKSHMWFFANMTCTYLQFTSALWWIVFRLHRHGYGIGFPILVTQYMCLLIMNQPHCTWRAAQLNFHEDVNSWMMWPWRWICSLISVNSSPPSAAYMRQCLEPALVQIMACRLFGAKPLSKPMLGYCQLDP